MKHWGRIWGVCLFACLSLPAYGQKTVKYHHTDALGSVVAVTDASGTVVERREYEPYGYQTTPAIQDGPGYTGHVQDAATGLTYMQQRYYDPQIGVFLSVDPITAYSNPVGQFNRYRYANGNPYKFIDPDGRLGCAASRISSVCGSHGMASTSVRSPLDTGPNQQSGSPSGSSSSGFSNANKDSRFAAASAEVSRMRETVEGTPHGSLDDAAAYFGQVLQPVVSEYGFEVFADINPLAGYRLENVFVSELADSDGIGIGANVPYGGLPTIHGHPVISESPPGLAPFSPQDVSWIQSTRDSRHYVSDSRGVYRFNGTSVSPTRVGP